MPINTRRRGYTAPGTKHEPLVRRLLSGRRVARDQERRALPVAPGPSGRSDASPAQRRAAALFAHVPALMPVLTPASDVPCPVPGQPRRRDRRAAARAEAKRRPTAGGYCPCSGVTDFYSDADRELWDQLHADCVAAAEQVSA